MKKIYNFARKKSVINASFVGTPSDNNGVGSNFSSTDYFLIPYFNPNGKTWVWNMKATLGTGLVTNVGYQLVGGYSNDSEGFEFGIKNNKFIIWLGSTVGSYDIANGVQGTATINEGTTFYVKVTFTGSQYILSYSFDGNAFVNDITINSTSSICGGIKAIGNDNKTRGQYWTGTIDFNYFNVTINNQDFYNGVKNKLVSYNPLRIYNGKVRPYQAETIYSLTGMVNDVLKAFTESNDIGNTLITGSLNYVYYNNTSVFVQPNTKMVLPTGRYGKEYSTIGLINNINNRVSGFENNSAIMLDSSFIPGSNNWEIVLHIFTENKSEQQTLLRCFGNEYYAPSIELTSDNKIKLSLSTSGTAWTYEGTSTTTVSPCSEYYIKLVYDKTNYNLYLTQDKTTWGNPVLTYNTSTALAQSDGKICFGCTLDDMITFSNPFYGTMDLNESYIKIADRDSWNPSIEITTDNYFEKPKNKILVNDHTLQCTGTDEGTYFGFVTDYYKVYEFSKLNVIETLSGTGSPNILYYHLPERKFYRWDSDNLCYEYINGCILYTVVRDDDGEIASVTPVEPYDKCSLTIVSNVSSPRITVLNDDGQWYNITDNVISTTVGALLYIRVSKGGYSDQIFYWSAKNDTSKTVTLTQDLESNWTYTSDASGNITLLSYIGTSDDVMMPNT